MKDLTTLLLGALVLSLISFTACRKPEGPADIRIGVVVPLTSGAADFGKWAKTGIDLAVANLKEADNGKQVIVHPIFEDSQMDPKTGLSAFKKLADIDKVKAIISSGSGVVLAIAPEANRLHLVQFNHAAVSPAIRKAGPYTFTLVNDADAETVEIARLATTRLGIKALAILYANTSYGVGTKDSVVKSFTKAGAAILSTVTFTEGASDFRAQLLELKNVNARAVYFIATIKDSIRILQQAAELDYRPQWLTYNAFESEEILKVAGPAAEGVIYTSSNLFDLDDPGPEPKKFLESYLKTYGRRPNQYAATAYDAVLLTVRALQTPGISQEAFRSKIGATRNYQGASGEISFDADGYANKPVFLKIVHGGTFQIYK